MIFWGLYQLWIPTHDSMVWASLFTTRGQAGTMALPAGGTLPTENAQLRRQEGETQSPVILKLLS